MSNIKFIKTGNIKDAIVDRIDTLIDTKLSDEVICFDPVEALEKFKKPLKRKQHLGYVPYSPSKKCWGMLPTRETGIDSSGSLFVRKLGEYYDDLSKSVAPLAEDDSDPEPLIERRDRRTWTCMTRSSSPYLALVNYDDTAGRNSLDESEKISRTVAVLDVWLTTVSREERLKRLAKLALSLFRRQADRRFVIAASLMDHSMFVAVFHRGGVLVSPAFDLHKDPYRFLRVVAGLKFVERKDLGFDPTTVYSHADAPEESEEQYVLVNGRKYPILEVSHAKATIRGRATVCFRVADCDDEDRELVIKDTWLYPSQRHEAEALQDVAGAKNVVKLEDVEYLEVLDAYGVDVQDTTQVHLNELEGSIPDVELERLRCKDAKNTLEHVRMVFSPVGTNLRYFRSAREVVSAIIDVVDAIEDLYNHGYVHRNINTANILFNDDDDVGNDDGDSVDGIERGERKAFLVDFSIAKKNGDEFAQDWKKGAILFTSVERLTSTIPIRHEYYHDLEAVFFLLLITCCKYSGPGNTKRVDRDIYKTSTIRGWTKDGIPKVFDKRVLSGINKELDCGYKVLFSKGVLNLVDPYFALLKGCLEELRSLVCGHYGADDDVFARKDGRRACERGIEKVHPGERKPKEYFAAFRDILWRGYEVLPVTPLPLESSLNSTQEDRPYIAANSTDTQQESQLLSQIDATEVSSDSDGEHPGLARHLSRNKRKLEENHSCMPSPISSPSDVHKRKRGAYGNITNDVDEDLEALVAEGNLELEATVKTRHTERLDGKNVPRVVEVRNKYFFDEAEGGTERARATKRRKSSS